MSRYSRGFNRSDPTAWKAIAWVDREAAKKDIRPRAEAIRKAKERISENGARSGENTSKTCRPIPL